MSDSIPELPQPEWFASGIIEDQKLSGFILSPADPVGRHKLRLRKRIFGIGEGDAELLERLVREQIHQAESREKERKPDSEDPSRVYRRWELVIPRFRGPDGREGPVLTAWALDPDRDKPHLTTTYPC